MTDEELKFIGDGVALESSGKLAELAVELFGDSAGPMLIGVAMKAWEKQMGKEHAIELAKRSLRVIVEEQEEPTAYQ